MSRFIALYLERLKSGKLYKKTIITEVAESFDITVNSVIQFLFQNKMTAQRLWGGEIDLSPKEFASYLANEFKEAYRGERNMKKIIR